MESLQTKSQIHYKSSENSISGLVRCVYELKEHFCLHRDFSVAIAPIHDRIEDLERPRGILFSSEHGLDRLVLRKELWCRTMSKDVDLHPLLDQTTSVVTLRHHAFIKLTRNHSLNSLGAGQEAACPKLLPPKRPRKRRRRKPLRDPPAQPAVDEEF